jgi:hypothetical protein
MSSPTLFKHCPTATCWPRHRALYADAALESRVGLMPTLYLGKSFSSVILLPQTWRDDTHATSFPIRFDHEESCAVRLPFAGRLLLASTVV